MFMPLLGVITTYALTAALGVCLGFILNGLMSAHKVADLYRRIDHVETLYQRQMVLLSDVAEVMKQLSLRSTDGDARSLAQDTLTGLAQVLSGAPTPATGNLVADPRFR